jgi:phenylalanine-4-hydroxylase
MGHVPLLADPEFADFSQEIGLASLGASDEIIEQLVRCYWYTIEFGIYGEGNKKRAYGAGLLSSFGELEYCLTDKPQYLPFDPFVCSQRPYPITTYQPVYYVVQSFEELKKKMRDFSNSLKRDFALRFNPFTLSIEILDSRKKLLNLCENLTSDLRTLQSAIQKIDGDLLEEPLD